MNRHPYMQIPDYARWSRALGKSSIADFDPIVDFPFQIRRDEKVATAGSCFAQHIANQLIEIGFNYFVVEDGHPIGNEALRRRYNYGTFSARYGNIYTPRQLLQLVQRAFDGRAEYEDYWVTSGGFIDPMRPAIQPRPFETLRELQLDRIQHLRAVQRMFEELDYFVFTLGLTEAWIAKSDGTVYPVCPGVAGGVFDSNKYCFKNFSIQEVIDDLKEAIERIQSVNRKARFILTVSPVPLVATAEPNHVLVSTTYSKSVLRVACEEIVRTNRNHIAYFPSYEIIVGNYNRGSYFAQDLRSVTDDGIRHVMRLFTAHASTNAAVHRTDQPSVKREDNFLAQALLSQQVVCEEELLELRRTSNEDGA